jgi:hypothetical protein
VPIVCFWCAAADDWAHPAHRCLPGPQLPDCWPPHFLFHLRGRWLGRALGV